MLEYEYRIGEVARVVGTGQHRIRSDVRAGGSVLRVRPQPVLCSSDEMFNEFCRLNGKLRIERGVVVKLVHSGSGRMGQGPVESWVGLDASGSGSCWAVVIPSFPG